MRLGQFARRYDLPVQDIINYLEEETGEKFHPNGKIYDSVETKLITHFDLLPGAVEDEEEAPEPVIEEPQVVAEPVAEEPAPEPSVEKEDEVAVPEMEEKPEPPALSAAEEIAQLGGDLAFDDPMEQPTEVAEHVEEVEEELEEQEVSTSKPEEKIKPEPAEDEVIQTDKLIELLESEEPIEGLDKIKLIKAPKRELAGLKVLGKVDLPEPKKKPEPEEKEEDRAERLERQRVSEEEREKRRLRAKRKKEEYDERQERRRKAKEAKEKKARKEEHYRQKLSKAEAQPVKRPAKKRVHVPMDVEPEAPQSQEALEPKQKPKSILGKFWGWLNAE